MEGLNQFSLYLLRLGKRPGTIRKHIEGLRNLQSRVNNFNKETLEQLLFEMYQQGRSPAHLNNLVASIHLYSAFIKNDELRSIKYFKVLETTKGVLSDKEITQFLAITPEKYNNHLRETLKRGGGHVDVLTWNHFTFFFKILAFSGLRPNELCQMRVGQCDLGSRVFRLDATTKTSKPRTVSINDALIDDLEKYLRTLKTDRMFPNWNRHKWQDQFKMRIRYLGITREKITTYSLRYSWIVRLLDEGANPHVMAEMAGHSLEQQHHYYKLTSKSKRIAIQKDPLSRKHLTRTERILQGRKALEDLGFTVFESQEDNGKIRFIVIDE